MSLIFFTGDDQDGCFSSTPDTDVFVKAGVMLGNKNPALQLTETGHDVTVQGGSRKRGSRIDLVRSRTSG